ncbi:MAG: hypothetical protein KDA29_01830 [Phycisphaerales bacterium]|nr:hypothetical protein [Phycisphaerales bacterium]
MSVQRLWSRFALLVAISIAQWLGVSSASAQSAKATINLDTGVNGAILTPIGSNPFFHYREQVAYGSPTIEELTSVYPQAHRVRVYPTYRWNDEDVTVFQNQSTSRLDFWFGDPFDGGTRFSYFVGTDRGPDLMRNNPVGGLVFKPYKLFVVGDRMIAYCAVQDDVLFRWSRIAILSARMQDIRSGMPGSWEVNFVTGEYSAAANNCGGIWAMSDPLFYEGAYWTVATDYDSGTKTGGQCWITKYDSTGLPVGMVRLHTRAGQVNEHWHSGTIIKEADHYKAVWHVGDLTKRLFYRQISSLAEFDANATTDVGSGVDGLYQTKVASSLDWGDVVVAAGPEEDEVLINSGWQNCFVLGQDPNDQSKFLYGGDVAAGLIQRVSIDERGVAVCETVFNPVSRNVRQQLDENIFQLNIFMVSRIGDSMVGIVSSQVDNGANVDPYSGIVQSEDGGQTWGWVWKGSINNGIVQNTGVTVLSNGRIIAGTLTGDHSVLSIIPGAKLSGKPLYVGFHPPNLLGDGSDQSIIIQGGSASGGPLISATTPEQPLPAIVHDERVFAVTSHNETAGIATLRLIQQGLDQELLSSASKKSNLDVAFWVRRSTPTTREPADRMQVDTRFGWVTPGGDYGMTPQRFSPAPKVVSNDWVRVLSQYDGENLTGSFLVNPGDLLASVTGAGGALSLGNNEVLFEYANIGHDRPALPYDRIDASGVSSAKFTGLGLGESWTVLVAMQIPEEAWDSWSGNESDAWDDPAPLLTISDASDQTYATIEAQLMRSAMGGAGVPFQTPDFRWMVIDSEDQTPSSFADYPLRTSSVFLALSKDGLGKLMYAVSTPNGVTSGSRLINTVINASTLRFSDIHETDALEMYIHQIKADCRAFTPIELETMVREMEFPVSDGPGCACLADLNDDDVLNFFDVSDFLQAYTNNETDADMNDDGQLNFFDVSLFLQAYQAGCS